MESPAADQLVTTDHSAADPFCQKIGRYGILGCLGAGGMGTVYKAHDPHLNRTVALKVPRIDTLPEDRAKRLERLSARGSLRCPGLAPPRLPDLRRGDTRRAAVRRHGLRGGAVLG